MNIDIEHIKSVSQKQLYIQFKTKLALEDDIELEIEDFSLSIDDNDRMDLKENISSDGKNHHLE